MLRGGGDSILCDRQSQGLVPQAGLAESYTYHFVTQALICTDTYLELGFAIQHILRRKCRWVNFSFDALCFCSKYFSVWFVEFGGMGLDSTISLIGVTGVLAPFLEETVFRGFFMTSLSKWYTLSCLSSSFLTSLYCEPWVLILIFVCTSLHQISNKLQWILL